MQHRSSNHGSPMAHAWLLALLLLVLAPLSASAQESEPPRFQRALTFLDQPGALAWSEDLLQRLHVPPGFQVNVFAQPGGNARWMAVHTDGTIYLSRQRQGDVVLLRDKDHDGQAEDIRTVASGLALVHGLSIYDTRLYLIAPTKVWIADIQGDGSLSAPRLLMEDLPDGGQHRARTIAVGPDNLLYMGVGSTCNACDETNPENATLLRANLDGSHRHIFARGLRHTIGFGWHPATGALWGMDMGTDERGNHLPPEELNHLVEGGHYGWPFCYGPQQVDRKLNVAPMGTTREAYCAATVPSVLGYQAHSAPIGFQFYTAAQFPAAYHGDAFIAFRGSWNRTPPAGYKVVRLKFVDGQPVAFEDFLTGFLVEENAIPEAQREPGVTYQFARLAGLAIATDGALLVADDANGVIYRIAYTGDTSR